MKLKVKQIIASYGLVAVVFMGAHAEGVPVFVEDFTSPPQSTIVPLGNVQPDDIEFDFANGTMTVPLASLGDGFQLRFPDLPELDTGRCFQFTTFIEPDEFDHNEAYIVALDVEQDGIEFRAIEVYMQRDPSWNKCRISVEYKDKDGNTKKGSVFFGMGQAFAKCDCPLLKNTSFDWVSDGMAQVEVLKFNDQGVLVDMYIGQPKKMPFPHSETHVVGVTIKKVEKATAPGQAPTGEAFVPGECIPAEAVPSSDEGGDDRTGRGGFVGGSGFNVQLQLVIVDDDHLETGFEPPITLAPQEGVQGETLDITVHTRDPWFTGKEEIDFGPDIDINTVQVLGAQDAILNITINPDAYAFNRELVINSGPTMEDEGGTVDFRILDLPPVPTVSEWGLSVMVLLLLTAGTVVVGRRRRPRVA